MKFTLVLLFAAVLAHCHGHGGKRHHKGRWMCRLITSQNPDVSMEDCLMVAETIRDGCKADYPEAEKQQIRSCMKDGMHGKFLFVTPFNMNAEQRAAFVTAECTTKNDDGTAVHGDAQACETRFNEVLNTCTEQSQDERAFRRCMKQQFQAIHHGDENDEEAGHGHGHGRHHHGGRHHQAEGEMDRDENASSVDEADIEVTDEEPEDRDLPAHRDYRGRGRGRHHNRHL